VTGKVGNTGLTSASTGAVSATAGDSSSVGANMSRASALTGAVTLTERDSASIGTVLEVGSAAGSEVGDAYRTSIGLEWVGVEGPNGAIREGVVMT
jgi:hypothetical protein